MELIHVEIVALVEEDQTQSSIVVLHDRQSNRVLPIWIGDPEARAIAVSLNNITMPRPITHQLLLSTIEKLGYAVSKIVVDRMDGQTYFATIYLRKGQEEVLLDARPSDSIALALAAKTPIFVSKDVMDKAGQKNPFPLPTEQTSMFGKQEGPRKIELSKQDFDRIADTLKRAREREEKSSQG